MPNLLIWYHCVIPPSKSGGRETSGNPSQPPPGSPAPCPTTSSESAKSSWLGYSALARATRVRVPVAEFGPVKSKPKPTSTCVEFVHVPSSWTLVPDSAALHTLSKYSIASARQRVRVVEETDSKSVGFCPQRFNPLTVASNIASISLADFCSGSYALARAGKKSVSGRNTLRFIAFHTET
jgi:hypothetical protein